MTLLAIVIVSWNVRELLAACLESISNLKIPGLPARAGKISFSQSSQSETLAPAVASAGVLNLESEILVMDNASQDGSADMVRERFPGVGLIVSPNNLGFAGGNNLAMREAGFKISDSGTARDASRAKFKVSDCPRYVLLLNPDTVVKPGAIEAMVSFMESSPLAGACGARLVYADGGFQHSAFGFPGLAQIALDFWPIYGRLLDSRLNGRYPRRRYAAGRPFEVDHPLGAALLVRAEAIAQVGLMDEVFYMYCEEIDWCWRIKRAGWKIYCVPQAEIVHYGGQSTAQARPDMVVALWRSRKRLYGKYYPAWKRCLAGALVRAGARAQIHRAGEGSALADAYRQVIEMFA